MRAAPGVASETVGLSSVGEPSVLRVGLERSTRFLARFFVCSSAPVSDSAFGSSAPSPRSRLPPPPSPLAWFGAVGLGRRGVAGSVVAGLLAGGLVLRGRGRGRNGRDGGRLRHGRRGRDRAEVGDRLHGSRQAGDLERLDRGAGRNVDGHREGLARHEGDRDAMELGGCGHDEQAEHGGGGERDDQLPSSHLGDASPLSRSIGAFLAPCAASLVARRGGRTVLVEYSGCNSGTIKESFSCAYPPTF